MAGCSLHELSCRCHPACQECSVKDKEKKVDVVCYGAKTETFCVPGPSRRGCKHSKSVCDPCDQETADADVTNCPRKFVWFDWSPTTAKVFTRTKLMKRVETVTVPTHEWKPTADSP
jgi:hypothetical protein